MQMAPNNHGRREGMIIGKGGGGGGCPHILTKFWGAF